jgi:uncharacterized protein YcsI (UPF0317 family)
LIGPTAGLAPGYVQANLAILPQAFANQFLRYCDANPKPCPVLAVSEPGEPLLSDLGDDLDVRTDVPRYLVFEDGLEVAAVSSVLSVWRSDLVTVAMGCSFSFDPLLANAGIPVRHLSQRSNVAVWRTNIATTPVGPFDGPMAVSMRPLPRASLAHVIQITDTVPGSHGAPVAWGDPESLGIHDLTTPHYGDAVPLERDDVPVFWACGVTAQVAIQAARIPFAITHAPGCMLVTDLRVAELCP